jgi:hypothetical protein
MASKRLASPAGWTRTQLNIYIPLPAGTGAVEAVTDLNLDYMYEVEKVTAVVVVAGTGSGASRVFRVLKGASTVVATATLVLADTDTVGKLKEFTVTDDGQTNHYEGGDLLTVDFPSAGAVAFTAGAVNLNLLLRTMQATLN